MHCKIAGIEALKTSSYTSASLSNLCNMEIEQILRCTFSGLFFILFLNSLNATLASLLEADFFLRLSNSSNSSSLYALNPIRSCCTFQRLCSHSAISILFFSQNNERKITRLFILFNHFNIFSNYLKYFSIQI